VRAISKKPQKWGDGEVAQGEGLEFKPQYHKKKKKKGVYDEALKYTNPKLTEPTREKGKSSRL
jgi:hypothetical protein